MSRSYDIPVITIVVEGGVIQDILDIPDDIRIVVKDYDVDGSEESGLKTDENDDQYVESSYKGKEDE